MSKLDDILDDCFQTYTLMKSEEVAKGKQQIKQLFLELIGDDYPSDYAKRKGYDAGVIATIEVNQRINQIRKKVEEL